MIVTLKVAFVCLLCGHESQDSVEQGQPIPLQLPCFHCGGHPVITSVDTVREATDEERREALADLLANPPRRGRPRRKVVAA